uniref:Uncharacterized protein n=1 Tax=uncultured Desulfobacterium sp. TaxID=201089 RepID=E1YFT5_9BACT|nr:unknown protein [uncultured Desulfobacterium sp.]
MYNNLHLEILFLHLEILFYFTQNTEFYINFELKSLSYKWNSHWDIIAIVINLFRYPITTKKSEY